MSYGETIFLNTVLAIVGTLVGLGLWMLFTRIPSIKKSGTYPKAAPGIISLIFALSTVRVFSPEVKKIYTVQTAEEKFLLPENPYKQIKAIDPEAYNRILVAFKNSMYTDYKKAGFGKPLSIEDKTWIPIARGEIQQLIKKNLPLCSDDSLIGFANLIVIEITEAMAKSPEACYAFLYPDQNNTVDPTQLFSQQTIKQEADFVGLFLGSLLPAPKPTMSDSEFQTAAIELLKGINATYPEVPKESPNYKNITCLRSLYINKWILSRPKEEAVKLLRYLYCQPAES